MARVRRALREAPPAALSGDMVALAARVRLRFLGLAMYMLEAEQPSGADGWERRLNDRERIARSIAPLEDRIAQLLALILREFGPDALEYAQRFADGRVRSYLRQVDLSGEPARSRLIAMYLTDFAGPHGAAEGGQQAARRLTVDSEGNVQPSRRPARAARDTTVTTTNGDTA